MRALASALILTSLLLGLSAGAGQAAKRATLAAAQASGLRGALGPVKPKPLQSPIPPLASSYATPAAPEVDAGSCHAACARSYYFCLAGESPEDCPQQWISCRSTCLQPAGPSAAHP